MLVWPTKKKQFHQRHFFFWECQNTEKLGLNLYIYGVGWHLVEIPVQILWRRFAGSNFEASIQWQHSWVCRSKVANHSMATINHQKTGYSSTKPGDIHQTNMGLPMKMDGLPLLNGYLGNMMMNHLTVLARHIETKQTWQNKLNSPVKTAAKLGFRVTLRIPAIKLMATVSSHHGWSPKKHLNS